jgi:anaerobic magnesium-protoporphyrin IX monomethyl ester cyclase
LPLDIALFHIAAPYPGTPFFYEVVENNWFRPGTKWEEVDMDQSTVLDYGNMSAERLEYWQKRATREWSMRPGPMLTFAQGAEQLGRLQERRQYRLANDAIH